MYRKYQNIYFLPGFFLICLLLLSNYGCDNVIPEEFKDKEYSAESTDANAAARLARQVGTDSAVAVSFYVVNARTISNLVDAETQDKITRGTITETQAVVSKFSPIRDSLKAKPVIMDSLMLIKVMNADSSFDNLSTVAYASFTVSAAQPKDIYIYTSLMFNANNLNEYCSVQLIKSDGSVVSSSQDMPQETVSSGTQVIDVSGGTRIVPTIKTRYSMHVDEGSYLLKITKSNTQVEFGRFVKLIILSK